MHLSYLFVRPFLQLAAHTCLATPANRWVYVAFYREMEASVDGLIVRVCVCAAVRRAE